MPTSTNDDNEPQVIPDIDWQRLLRETEGLFDVELLRRHYNIYGANSGPMTEPQAIRGLVSWFTTHMRALRMKVSVATSNETRYLWLCQHYFVEERMHADPQHYHVFPYRNFYTAPRFYVHFFASFFAFLDQPFVKFIIAMMLMFKMHTWSHELYMVPLPLLKMPYSCSELPTQPACEVLNFVQRNTFEGLHDMNKTLVTLVMTWFVSLFTSMTKTMHMNN